jgi:hypothetical protein
MNYNFLNLTNANPLNRGERVAIRRNLIVSVFTAQVMRDGEEKPTAVTCVFAPPHGTWEVEESYEEVFKQLNKTEDGVGYSAAAPAAKA